MFQSLLLFLAPQASPDPVVDSALRRAGESERTGHAQRSLPDRLRFHISVIGNAMGLFVMMVGAWALLNLLRAYLPA